MRHAALIGALCAVCATACSEEGPNISGVKSLDIVRVNISPKLDTLFVADTLRPGDRLQMQAEVIGRLGTPILSAKVAWASSKPEVATVNASGVVIPTGYGTTVVSASASKVANATIVVMPAARTVVVSPGSDTIFVEDPIAPRDSIVLKATAYDESGNAIAGVAFSWSSALAAMATVNTRGSVLARGLGVVTVSARSGENVGSANVRVASIVKSIQTASPVTTVLAKDTVQLTATALGYDDKAMAGRTFTWTSSNPQIATVDANGRAIFLRSGSATFTAKSAFTTSAVTVGALERQFQQISSGDDYTCGFTNLGRGYCWGADGALASPADSTCSDADPRDFPVGGGPRCTLAPKRFGGTAIEFTALEAGDGSACAISKDRMIYCWGSGSDGQLGNGSRGGSVQPTLATVAQERFDSITVGGAHACGLNVSRRAYCWGDDSFGQLGDDRRVISTTPIPVIGGHTFSSISAGGTHTCGISNGQAYCWGDNTFGQLGLGTFGDQFDTPQPVGGPYVAISAGGRHTCALSTTGTVDCWGVNDSLQVGGQPDLIVPTPTAVGGGTFSRISAGFNHTCALTAAGAVSCWGANLWAQLGNGGVSASGSMGPVESSVAFKSITSGSNHTCALGNDGETYCWGSNVFGALGNELQAAYRATPQKVAIPR